MQKNIDVEFVNTKVVGSRFNTHYIKIESAEKSVNIYFINI